MDKVPLPLALLQKIQTPDIERSFSPDKILWLEVIHRAYHDYQHFWIDGARSPSKLYHARSAQKWMQSKSEEITSFLWACFVVFDKTPKYFASVIRQKCSAPLPTKKDLFSSHYHPPANPLDESFWADPDDPEF